MRERRVWAAGSTPRFSAVDARRAADSYAHSG